MKVKTWAAACFFALAAPVAASEQVLTVWNMPVTADKLQRQVWEEEIKGFNVFFPGTGIRGISREYKPQEFVSVMASGKGPDIVRIPVTAIPVMAQYGFLAKLDGFTERWTQKDYMPAIMWNSVNVDGNIYGIPYDSYFTTLFYRRDIFEKCGIKEAPATWKDIVKYSRIINDTLKNTWGIAFPPDMFNFMDFIWQAGGDFYDDARPTGAPGNQSPTIHSAKELGTSSYSEGRLALDGPGVIKALKFWHDLKWLDIAMPPQNIMYESDVEQYFSTGKIAMMAGVANRLPVMARRYGLDLSQVEIVPLPAGNTGIKAWHAGGDAFIINAGISEEKKKLAWEYIKYVLSPLNQLWKWKRMKELGMVIFPGDFSCATNLINMPEFAKVKGLLSYAHAEPTFTKWPMIKEDFNRYVLEKIFTDREADFEGTLLEFSKRVKREYNGR